MWRQTGKKPEQLNNELPESIRYLWEWFLDLHGTRGSGLEGIQPITFVEIEAWSRLTGNFPEYWEVNAIKKIDSLARKPK